MTIDLFDLKEFPNPDELHPNECFPCHLKYSKSQFPMPLKILKVKVSNNRNEPFFAHQTSYTPYMIYLYILTTTAIPTWAVLTVLVVVLVMIVLVFVVWGDLVVMLMWDVCM